MDKKKLPKCLQALDALLAFSVRGKLPPDQLDVVNDGCESLVMLE